MFVVKRWVITQKECDERRVKGQKVCPPEVKILGALYWLGEGCSFRTIYNLSGRVLSDQSFCDFCKKFCHRMRVHLAPQYIKMSGSVEELRHISKTYAERGFPGACGSTDGVQIAWEGCPHAYRNSFTGKEKYPTLGFNVTVGHDRRILHVDMRLHTVCVRPRPTAVVSCFDAYAFATASLVRLDLVSRCFARERSVRV